MSTSASLAHPLCSMGVYAESTAVDARHSQQLRSQYAVTITAHWQLLGAKPVLGGAMPGRFGVDNAGLRTCTGTTSVPLAPRIQPVDQTSDGSATPVAISVRTHVRVVSHSAKSQFKWRDARNRARRGPLVISENRLLSVRTETGLASPKEACA
jgi:hypothetical protein